MQKIYAPRIRLSHEEYEIIRVHRGLSAEFEGKDNPEVHQKIPKYLLLDIETLPAETLVFHLGEQRIPHDHLLSDVVVVCWSAKYLYSPDMISDCMTSEEAVNRDDKRIMQSLWKLLEDSECLIGHNIDKFDVKIINSRFWYHKMKPTTPYQTIDTLKASRKSMGTMSHRLDYLGKFIERKGKLATSFDLWKRCHFGEQEALNYMLKYNKEDVLLLEDVYVEMRPWIKPHPNYAIYSEANVSCCSCCGGTNLSDVGIYVTQANRYISKRCNDCGSFMRERVSDITRQERNNLLISTAR